MGLIGRILEFARVKRKGGTINASEVKIDPGGGANLRADHWQPVGDDSRPLPLDYCLTVPIQRTGGAAVVGYGVPGLEPKAEAGEKRIYSRDDAGNVVAEAWLKNDGEIELKNDAVSMKMEPDGTATIENELASIKIDALGQATIANNLGSIKLMATGFVVLNNTVTVDLAGNLLVPGTLTVTTAISCLGAATLADMNTTGTGDVINFNSHFHGGVTAGGADTGGPDS